MIFPAGNKQLIPSAMNGIAVSGFSGSGKTTLIEKIIPLLSTDYSVGYLKHHGHCGFEYDGLKDSDRMKTAGASRSAVSDGKSSRIEFEHDGGDYDRQKMWSEFEGCDVVIAEGFKNVRGPKIVFVDAEQKIIEDIQADRIKDVIALIGTKGNDPQIGIPFFDRDRYELITNWLLKFLRKKALARPLYGLVLGGGKSTRMGQDKAVLKYHGKKAHACYTGGLLESVCRDVYISRNQFGDDSDAALSGFPKIFDRFCDFGPLGGMLSAFSHSPEASWFVLACDLPYIDQKLLEHIVQQRDPLRMATAYKSAEGQLPEPMCAIYEPKIRGRLFDSLKMNRLCPRKILIQSSIKLLEPLREQALYNANQFHEYEQVLDHLGKGMTF
jgi:molybdenum cofactor guanylyltransferase